MDAPPRSDNPWGKLLGVIGLTLLLVWGGTYVNKLQHSKGWIRDGDGYVLGTDFLNSWLMARAGLESKRPEKNYNIAVYTDTVRTVVADTHYPAQQWSYAPNYMLMMLPFGLLPYFAAWALFMALSMVTFACVLRLCALHRWPGILAVFGTPASLLALMSGQITLLAASAQLASWRWMDREPWLAGMLIGLVSVKPQLGLLYPFFFFATRRWKCFVGAALTSLALVAVSMLCWGLAPWQHYFAEGVQNQLTYVLMTPPHSIMALMPTLYMDSRIAGLAHSEASLVQGMVTVLAISLLFTRRFRGADNLTQMLVFAGLSVAATPYLMAYDVLFSSIAAILYLGNANATRGRAYLVIAFMLMPLLHMLCANAGIPGTALLPLAVAIVLLYGDDVHSCICGKKK